MTAQKTAMQAKAKTAKAKLNAKAMKDGAKSDSRGHNMMMEQAEEQKMEMEMMIQNLQMMNMQN